MSLTKRLRNIIQFTDAGEDIHEVLAALMNKLTGIDAEEYKERLFEESFYKCNGTDFMQHTIRTLGADKVKDILDNQREYIRAIKDIEQEVADLRNYKLNILIKNMGGIKHE